MEPRYSILDHPSDIGIEARGRTLAEAFCAAAEGLISVILDPATLQPREWKELRITAGDVGQLAVKWLSEILYLYDGQAFAAAIIEIAEISDNSLTARLGGEHLITGHHRTRMDVKAVTYHQLSVIQEEGRVVIRVFLDI